MATVIKYECDNEPLAKLVTVRLSCMGFKALRLSKAVLCDGVFRTYIPSILYTSVHMTHEPSDEDMSKWGAL